MGQIWFTLTCQKCGKSRRCCYESDIYYDEYGRPPDEVELKRCRSCVQKDRDKDKDREPYKSLE